jgi:23S rRNA (uracil1939-C5)-methyltransferase
MPKTLVLLAERPVAGGLSLARHDGRVVLLSGAIPGELVLAKVERATKQVLFASTQDVMEPSPFRREPVCDAACGGLSYAHIAYDHQLELKAEVLADTFRRLGKMTLEAPVSVAASPERGYRLRARLHVRHGQVGFFREGGHQLCDAAPGGQMSGAMLDTVRTLVDRLGRRADRCDAVTVIENVLAQQRVVHLEPYAGALLDLAGDWRALSEGMTGLTTQHQEALLTLAGVPSVHDTAEHLCGDGAPVPSDVGWSRTAASFFQGNRYLTGRLLLHVIERASGMRVLDLYAGVGLFAVPLAARGATVTAVEGDPASGADLTTNAAPWASRLHVQLGSVEAVVPAIDGAGRFDVVIVDPPRTGLSPEAMAAVAALRSPRIVYISCDPATLARDASRLVAAGYRMTGIEGFDMFPNTPHIETVSVFDRPE